MKKTKILPFLICIASMLCGCFPTGELEIVSEDYKEILEKAETIENFSLDIELPKENYTELPTLYGTFSQWDAEVVKSAFLNEGEEILEHFEYVNNGFPEEKHYGIITTKNVLGWKHGCITDLTFFEYDSLDNEEKKYPPRTSICEASVMYDFNYNSSKFSEDLETFTAKEALERADALLAELGITNVAEPNIYAITKEFAALVAEVSPGEIDWTAEDEVYYIIYPFKAFENTTMYKHEITMMGEEYYGLTESSVKIVMAHDKILDFDCCMYPSSIEASESTDKIISAVDATKILVDYYAKITNDYEIVIDTIRLEYVPVKLNGIGFVYEPAWVFEGSKASFENYSPRFTEVIYAKTGIRNPGYTY